MKLSKSFWQTFKEAPKDAEIPSHKLMIRAGLIHKTGSGLYSLMPFGLKVIQKIEKLMREEFNAYGFQEIMASVVTPGELWKESGRWDVMGPLMLRFADKGQRELCFSPTNEESFVDIFRKSIKSYKQLPQTLYQINLKFRDEIRPRFGLMRAREFIMKDAYSFHSDWDCLDKTYQDFYQAYSSLFTKIGLEFMAVEADAGNMGDGKNKTHEFQVLAENGEDQLIVCPQCAYSANTEKAITKPRPTEQTNFQEIQLEKVNTSNCHTIEEVCTFLNILPEFSLKSVGYQYIQGDRPQVIIVFVRGHDQVNEIKLKNNLNVDEIKMLGDEEIKSLGIIKGVIGPIGLPEGVNLLFDSSIEDSAYYTVGSNEKEFHLKGFNLKRDLKKAVKEDIRLSKEGDICSHCSTPVIEKKGIEVGHIFQLGDKYTRSMNASILDKSGKSFFPLMGCYGIGVTRVMAAAIEQKHDSSGIIWPKAITPFDIYLVVISKNKEFIESKAEELYKKLKQKGYDVLFDDRDQGPGHKFKDFELLGVPLCVVLGERDYNEKGTVEIKFRENLENSLKVPFEKVFEELEKVRES